MARAWLRALRLHQWAKNALVFAPLVLGGKALDVGAWSACALGFLAFGLLASSTYLLNDLWDLPDDRRHWSKRERPLASGRLPIRTALLLAPLPSKAPELNPVENIWQTVCSFLKRRWLVPRYAGNEGCAGWSGAEPHASETSHAAG